MPGPAGGRRRTRSGCRRTRGGCRRLPARVARAAGPDRRGPPGRPAAGRVRGVRWCAGTGGSGLDPWAGPAGRGRAAGVDHDPVGRGRRAGGAGRAGAWPDDGGARGRPGRLVRPGSPAGGGRAGGDRRARRLPAGPGRVLPAQGAAPRRPHRGWPGWGTSRSFVVERVERRPKAALPAGRIWNHTPRPVLRLITCGGGFDRASGHYRDNLIVYAAIIT
jgi:hypothetical protein